MNSMADLSSHHQSAIFGCHLQAMAEHRFTIFPGAVFHLFLPPEAAEAMFPTEDVGIDRNL